MHQALVFGIHRSVKVLERNEILREACALVRHKLEHTLHTHTTSWSLFEAGQEGSLRLCRTCADSPKGDATGVPLGSMSRPPTAGWSPICM